MKTLYAPDSLAAWLDHAQSLIAANPIAGFALVTIACAFFATWAAK